MRYTVKKLAYFPNGSHTLGSAGDQQKYSGCDGHD